VLAAPRARVAKRRLQLNLDARAALQLGSVLRVIALRRGERMAQALDLQNVTLFSQ
jgi:hypothetical protein